MAVMISMVMLDRQIELPASAIERELRARYPELNASLVDTQNDVQALKLKNADLILGNMPAPIPWSDLEGPCATSVLWKDAATPVRAHSAHIIVTLSSDLTLVDQAILLTRATAAVLAAIPEAIGVYWGNATLLVPKPLFLDFAQEILPNGPPIDIWIDFRVGWESEKRSSGFTTGLRRLGHMEIEVLESPEKPSDLRQRLHGLATYLLQNGPVIKDGHTVGEDEYERIRVVISDSSFGYSERVMQLRYEATKNKPWWKII